MITHGEYPNRGATHASAPERTRGRLRLWSVRGFGFVTRDDGGADVFVFIKEAKRCGIMELAVGDRLEFDAVQTDRGVHARNIKIEGK